MGKPNTVHALTPNDRNEQGSNLTYPIQLKGER